MQQRQPRLGDILDDYCPRERRLTNHVVVAMIGADVKQTRCTTCDAEHEYKHAKVPRQRRKADTPPALYSQVAAGAPKRVPHDEPIGGNGERFDNTTVEPEEPPLPAPPAADPESVSLQESPMPVVADLAAADEDQGSDDGADNPDREEGPVHRPLIRASL